MWEKKHIVLCRNVFFSVLFNTWFAQWFILRHSYHSDTHILVHLHFRHMCSLQCHAVGRLTNLLWVIDAESKSTLDINTKRFDEWAKYKIGSLMWSGRTLIGFTAAYGKPPPPPTLCLCVFTGCVQARCRVQVTHVLEGHRAQCTAGSYGLKTNKTHGKHVTTAGYKQTGSFCQSDTTEHWQIIQMCILV